MAKSSTELLQGILTTVVKIEQKMGQDEKPKAAGAGAGLRGMVGIAGSLVGFGKIKDETKKSFVSFMKDISDIVKDDKGKNFGYFSEGIVQISAALPDLVSSLNDLGRMRTRRVDAGLMTLRRLYEFMHEMGDGRSARRVERAINLFDKMGKALEKLAKPLRQISSFLIILGVGIVTFAAALLLTSALLKLSKPTDALLFLGFTIVSLVLMFGMLAIARKVVDRGTDTIKDIGWGMVTLGLGIVAFALTLKVLPMILGSESGGSIAGSLLLMGVIVAAAVGMFAIIGLASGLIKKGTTVIFMMTLGMFALSAGLIALSTTAKFMMGGGLTLGKDTTTGDEKDENKKAVRRGLGMMGLVILASVALFALLGIPVVAGLVMLGSATAIAMSAALIVLAKGISDMAKVSKDIPPGFSKNISTAISGLVSGVVGGLSLGLSGKEETDVKKLDFGGFAKLRRGLRILRVMSRTVSLFAKALGAFAELDNMRIISGYKDDGEPIFGDKVNITQVASNLSLSIATFLRALITSTTDLEKSQAKAIKKMGRALTGRRGILSAAIQFADVLKVYSEFGEKNEIGYMTYDEQGNEVRKYVSVNKVVSNMVGAFTTFTNALFTQSEKEFGDGEPVKTTSRKQIRRMKKMSKALTGKHGILGAVMKFADTLKTFAEFGEKNEIPIFDEEGKQVDTVSVDTVADNIVTALSTFADTLANKLEKGEAKDAGKALKKYEGMIEKLNKLSTSMDSMQRITSDVQGLANAVGDLAVNLDSVNTDKLAGIIEKSAESGTRVVYAGGGGGGTTSAPAFAAVAPSGTVAGSPQSQNWDQISQQIGDVVGQRVAASMKNGQFVFEFDTTKSGGVYYWSPK